MMNQKILKSSWVLLLLLANFCITSEAEGKRGFTLFLTYPTPFQPDETYIYNESTLLKQYDASSYLNTMTCTNNEFQVLEFVSLLKNATGDDKMAQEINFRYETKAVVTQIEVGLQAFPNKRPLPELKEMNLQTKEIVLKNNCSLREDIGKQNYFNRIVVTLKVSTEDGKVEEYPFSFLMDCDKGERHKKFQFGYMVISLLNSLIIVGVALHSRIWSIRYNRYPLAIELKWNRFLIFILAAFAISAGIYFYASEQFKNANIMMTYLGLVFALFFSFVCWDEILFLSLPMRATVFRVRGYRIRRCDLASGILAAAMFLIGVFVENWIYNDILAVCICVGAIKLFKFRSMKQGTLSLLISTGCFSLAAAIMHYTLERSYNDYATELASPIFLTIPDLINSLYKKCSWMPVLDVIVPGVFLSFLRKYDENYNTGLGGVYTLFGNLAFILGTMFWCGIEAFYPFSVPFSLISYTTLFLSVGILAIKRNEFKTLWEGRFNGAMMGNQEFLTDLLDDDEEDSTKVRTTFGKMIGKDILDDVKYGNIKNSDIQSEEVDGKVWKSKLSEGRREQQEAKK